MGGQLAAKPYLFGRPGYIMGPLGSVTSDSAVCPGHLDFALPLRTQRAARSFDLVLKSTLALLQLTETAHRADLRSEYQQQAKVCLKKASRLLLGSHRAYRKWGYRNATGASSRQQQLCVLCFAFFVRVCFLSFFCRGRKKQTRRS